MPVDGDTDLLVTLVSLRQSMAEVPATGSELQPPGTIKSKTYKLIKFFRLAIGS